MKDFYIQKKNFYGATARNQTNEISQSIAQVYQYREQKRQQMWAGVLGALNQMASPVQQYNINQELQKSGGVVTPQIQAMQYSKAAYDFSAKMWQAQSGHGTEASFDAAWNPMSNVTLVQQLIDPKMGVNPQGIIKGFAKIVASVSKNGCCWKVRQLLQRSSIPSAGNQNRCNEIETAAPLRCCVEIFVGGRLSVDY